MNTYMYSILSYYKQSVIQKFCTAFQLIYKSRLLLTTCNYYDCIYFAMSYNSLILNTYFCYFMLSFLKELFYYIYCCLLPFNPLFAPLLSPLGSGYNTLHAYSSGLNFYVPTPNAYSIASPWRPLSPKGELLPLDGVELLRC